MFQMKKINFQSTFVTAHFSMMLFPRLHSFWFQIKKKLNFSSLNSWEMKWQRYPACPCCCHFYVSTVSTSTGCEIYFTKNWKKFFSSRWLNETSMIKTTKGFSFCQTFVLCSIVEFFQLIQKLQLLSLFDCHKKKLKLSEVWENFILREFEATKILYSKI